MSTPTIGELERRIADLEARADEADSRLGILDGEPEQCEGREMETFGLDGKYEAELIYEVPGWFKVYRDVDGDYWLTSACDTSDAVFMHGPDELRELADAIEEVEQ